MAYSKIILNGETLMDVTSDTVDAGNLLSGKTATKNSGAKVTGNIATKSSSDLTVSGATVTAPAGYYSATASKAVATTTHPNPTATIASSTGVVTASHTQGTGYVTGGTTTGTLNLTTQAAQTINTSTADQTIASNRWLTGTQTIKSVTTTNLTAANIAEGVTVKVGDANNASRITQVTGTHSGGIEHTATIDGAGNSTYCYVQHNGVKYYTNGATFTFKEGDTITFFVRGASDSYITYGDGTIAEATSTAGVSYNYTALGDDLGIYFNYGGSAQQNSIAFYLINISLENRQVTPTEQYQYVAPLSAYAIQNVTVNPISSTYVGTGVAKKSSNDTTFASTTGTFTAPIGYYSAAATKTITTQAAQTIYPSTADQTVPSYRWLTGTQTIKSVTTSNLTAANIASGVVVKVGDANNASRIAQITGTHSGAEPDEGRYMFYITGTADNSYHNHIVYDSKDYEDIGDSKKFNSGDSITVYAISNRGPDMIYLDGNLVADSGQGTTAYYTFNPTTSFDVEWQGTNSTTCYITTYKLPQGTLNINANGTYDVTNYNSAFVSVGSATGYTIDDIATRNISGDISGNATTIRSYAFAYCSTLTSVSFPAATSIGASAFYACSALTSVSFPAVTSIGNYAFAYCPTLTSASFPAAKSIGNYAFSYCSALTTANFPSCTWIGTYAFYYCASLTTVNFPSCTLIGQYAFYSCINLTTVSFSSCTSIGNSAFTYCSKLTTANFPNVLSIGGSAFSRCSMLSNVSFPKLQFIGSSAFCSCSSLITISLPAVTSINNAAFYYCTRLTYVYLLGSSVPYLGATNTFGYCTSLSRIYVPSSLYNSYLTGNWASVSSYIYSI